MINGGKLTLSPWASSNSRLRRPATSPGATFSRAWTLAMNVLIYQIQPEPDAG
jgi:hypothetical protein